MIRIDHEKYGIETVFKNIEDAVKTIKACGTGFENTELRVRLDNNIEDQDGEIVGEAFACETFYGCSECDYVLSLNEEFCPDHPNAIVVGPIKKNQ